MDCSVLVKIDGKVVSSPEFVNKFNKVRIFRVKITNKRPSGVVDTFLLNYSSEIGVVLKYGDTISVVGDIRTLNDKNSDNVIEGFIFAKSIRFLQNEPDVYKNECSIKNANLIDFKSLSKYRGRDIASYQVMLDRGHSRFSYFSVSTWDSDAITLGNVRDTLELLNIKCRLQSYTSKKSKRMYISLVTYSLDLVK